MQAEDSHHGTLLAIPPLAQWSMTPDSPFTRKCLDRESRKFYTAADRVPANQHGLACWTGDHMTGCGLTPNSAARNRSAGRIG